MKIKSGKETEYTNYVEVNSVGDRYGRCTLDYTERWADLMESKLAAGKKLEDIASETSHKADTEGITRFMYGCAVYALAKFWEHGEALRRWQGGMAE